MVRKAERPIDFRQVGLMVRIAAVAGVIVTGAALWGYAVYEVAMRTM